MSIMHALLNDMYSCAGWSNLFPHAFVYICNYQIDKKSSSWGEPKVKLWCQITSPSSFFILFFFFRFNLQCFTKSLLVLANDSNDWFQNLLWTCPIHNSCLIYDFVIWMHFLCVGVGVSYNFWEFERVATRYSSC